MAPITSSPLRGVIDARAGELAGGATSAHAESTTRLTMAAGRTIGVDMTNRTGRAII